ncbi:MAG: hypothetical protein ASARMPREDX12_000887 [Alectoria sarmentosa]|nr:MAG: hypothetical protein ASARMPREDX12_000887 [Alectoria sarmentosa]
MNPTTSPNFSPAPTIRPTQKCRHFLQPRIANQMAEFNTVHIERNPSTTPTELSNLVEVAELNVYSLAEAAEKSRKPDEIMKESDTEDDANVKGGRDRSGVLKADKLRTQQQLEALQARYIGTGHADTTKHEWLSNIHRDSYASYIGHPPLLAYMSVGMGECRERVRAGFLERMVRPVGRPPAVVED